ncbi:MAG: hypothetical protein H0T04_06220 [Chloroflexi bacterium]|nr:hypothetical protein [Chloroflexota bacterium]
MSPPLIVSRSEMETAVRIFREAVAHVAGSDERVRQEADAAGAMSGVEASG